MSDEIQEALQGLSSRLAGDDDFYEEFGGVFATTKVDRILDDHFGENSFRSVQALARIEEIRDEWPSGKRVAFVTNLDSVLTYGNFPDPGTAGTVVKVRTGTGDATMFEERVFVLWDDGKMRPILAKHLKPSPNKTATNVRMVVADLGDIATFFTPTTAGDELVHKATKDLWSLQQNGEGFVLERLFQQDGKPLKV
jgi:hypothetical protein